MQWQHCPGPASILLFTLDPGPMQYLLGSLQQLSRMLTVAGRRDVSSAAAVLSPGWCPPPGSVLSVIQCLLSPQC